MPVAIRVSARSCLGLFFCALACTVHAQVRPRITRPIDEASVVRLQNTTHPLAKGRYHVGRADRDLPMERIILVLKSSPEQEAELEQLIADQQDPYSPRFHQWLSPEEFGRQFGPAQEDMDTVAHWLEDRGFRIDSLAPGRRAIEFSGAAGQVEQAFGTEIHRYSVNGESHIANSADIAIPEALAGVVGGVASLHDFHARPLHRTAAATPEANLTGGGHGIVPYDFAAIYNLTPLWNSNFDGTGQTIAVAGRTNINHNDIATFRSKFGLAGNNTQVVLNGRDPGIVSPGEETEADLDVEWAGAVAKGATIKFVISANTSASDGIDLSSQYIVSNNLASVMTLSFGSCEAAMGTAGNQFYSSLWSQAVAEGISVFVATGDSGSAGCDDPESQGANGQNTTLPASRGLGVNGLASTPYNVAVGGTQFNDNSAATYWNAANDAHLASVKGYIPESVWNESGYTTSGASGNSLWAGSGGVSGIYATPSWQTGTGVPAADPGTTTQHHRYLPDVSLTAAGHDGYIVQQEGTLGMVSGTSASTPAFAGIMAIVNQFTGARNGNPNQHFYPLAARTPAVYHDTTSGTNAVPCKVGTSGCSAPSGGGTVGKMSGYSAGAGFDLATGWGSVDAYALALNWGATPTAGPVVISLSPGTMTGSTSNQALTITGTGFKAGASVKASYAGSSTTLQTSSITATQIQATINTGTTARAWTIQVINPGGAASSTVTLQVNAPGPTPAITALSPTPMIGSASTQALTITGTGFLAGATVKASYTGFSTTLQTSSITATQIQATINVGTTARTWSVQVANPNGTTSSTATLQVNAPVPPPAITALSPSPMTGSNSNQALTIKGTGFLAGATVKASCSSSTVVLQASSISATQIQATINVGTTARTWTVQVTNASGLASDAATLQVNAPPVPPVITSLSPSPMTGSTSNQALTITGTGFLAGATVKASYTGSTITLQVSSISTTQIVATITVGPTARTWTVQVTNANGEASNTATLQVNAPAPLPPAITSLSPNPMTGSASLQTLLIKGTGFQPGALVQASYTGFSTNLQVTSITPTQIQATINTGTAARAWTVKAVNPGGTASNLAVLQVTAPAAHASPRVRVKLDSLL